MTAYVSNFPLNDINVMGNKNKRHPQILIEFLEQCIKLFLGTLIDPCGWFVQKNNLAVAGRLWPWR